MLFQVDSKAATAVYRQLVDQVCYAAASGTLKPGDPLPTIRPLARQLHMNRNTVAKAYTELENLGVIKTVPGKGCFVQAVNTPFTLAVRDKLLDAKIDAALIAAHQLQVDAAAFSVRVAERMKAFENLQIDGTEKPDDEGKPAESISRSVSVKKKKPKAAIVSPKPTPSPGESLSVPEVEGWTPLTD